MNMIKPLCSETFTSQSKYIFDLLSPSDAI